MPDLTAKLYPLHFNFQPPPPPGGCHQLGLPVMSGATALCPWPAKPDDGV
jgi:hypothetical protein